MMPDNGIGKKEDSKFTRSCFLRSHPLLNLYDNRSSNRSNWALIAQNNHTEGFAPLLLSLTPKTYKLDQFLEAKFGVIAMIFS